MIDWGSVKKSGPSPAPSAPSGTIDWSMAGQSGTNVDTAHPAVATALSTAGNLIQRPSQAGVASAARGLGQFFPTLMHGTTPEQSRADLDKIEKGLPPQMKPVNDFMLGTLLDPTTFIGGSGALEKGVGEVGLRAAQATAKAVPETTYAALVHNGAAVKGIYKALPAKKAQGVIAALEQASRKLSNDDIELMVNKKYDVDTVDRAKMYAALGLKRSEKAAVEPYLDEYFGRKEAATPGDLGKAAGQLGETAKAIQGITNIPYFFNPTRHMANIASLAALYDSIGTAQSIGRTALSAIPKYGKKALAANREMIAVGRDKGLTSTAVERQLPDFMQRIGPLTKMYNWSQKTLWGFDDLTRNVLIEREAKRLVTQGMRASQAEALAAHNVNRALVDYTMRSPATKGMYYIAPFATFRTKIPGAVVRSVMKHPERLQVADRLTQGQASGGTQGTGADQGKSYLPVAEVFRALSSAKGADQYLRSTLSWPVKDLLTGLVKPPVEAMTGQLRPGQGEHFLTYGQPVWGKLGPGTPPKKRGILPSQILGGIPGADQLLGRLGMSPFPPSSAQNEVLQMLGQRIP